MAETRPLRIPVILGTTRKGRMSAHAARFVHGQLAQREGVVSELIDIAELALPVDDAGEAIKDPGFARSMEEADGVVIVAPEYNHSFPGLLKHVLDSAEVEIVAGRTRSIGAVGLVVLRASAVVVEAHRSIPPVVVGAALDPLGCVDGEPGVIDSETVALGVAVAE